MLNYESGLNLMFQALSDPARRSIIERLSRGPASVSDLAAPLPMSLAAVVQHLDVLQASGLVKTQKIGRVRTCTLDGAALSLAEHWINTRRADWARRLDRLGVYLADTDDDIPGSPST